MKKTLTGVCNNDKTLFWKNTLQKFLHYAEIKYIEEEKD